MGDEMPDAKTDTKPVIIAVLGSSGSGKSEVAKHLAVHYRFTRVRFAEPLKDMLRAIGLTAYQLDGPQDVRNLPSYVLCGKSPRYAMQTLGTEWRDFIGKELWSRILHHRIEDMLTHTETRRFVIDDARFHHEMPMLRDLGAVIVAVRRKIVEPTRTDLFFARIPLPKLVRAAFHVLFGVRPLHISETEWFGIKPDIVIDNNGPLGGLWSAIDDLVALKDET